MNLTELLNEMTLSEKIGQLVQLPADSYIEFGKITGNKTFIDNKYKYLSGSTLGICEPDIIKEVQRDYMHHHRLKIPLFFGFDVIHGLKTSLPIPLAMAASFSEELIEKGARLAAKESYYSGISVTFSPMADRSEDSRWGRIMESCGEDTYLGTRLIPAYVRGYQGENLKSEETIASCLKHYAGYGLAQGGRDYNTVDISRRTLKEYHLPIYHSAIKAGAKMTMTSFNLFEGMPATANEYLLKTQLRKNLHFDGVILSDWNGVGELVEHRVAPTAKDAAKQAINNGLNIEMASTHFLDHLANLVKEGEVEVDQIDEACLRVLEFKDKLGLFENPNRGADFDKLKEIVSSNEAQTIAYLAAAESIVLLKNKNNTLPLNNQQKIVLTGPNADETKLNGAWTLSPSSENRPSLTEIFSQKMKIIKPLGLKNLNSYNFGDVIIYAGGEKEGYTGESQSMMDIEIEESQIADLKQLKKSELPIIFLNYSGRGIALTEIEKYCDAIVQVWFLGQEMSRVIVDLLLGKISPIGKLPISFPRKTGQMPYNYAEFSTGRFNNGRSSSFTSSYVDDNRLPLYPFGYGLTYGEIEIIDYKLNNFYAEKEIVEVIVKLENKNNNEVTETVQVYVKDDFSSLARPIKELRNYQRVTLKANEQKEIKLILTKESFKFVNKELEWVIEDGSFTIMVGFNSRELLEKEMVLAK